MAMLPEMDRANWKEVVHDKNGLTHRFYRVGFRSTNHDQTETYGYVTIPGSGCVAQVKQIGEHEWQELEEKK